MGQYRFGLWLLVMGMALLLAACSSVPYDSAYLAAGDGTQPDELSRTTVFQPDDDLNVVVELNSHNREIPVQAIFTTPSGAEYTTDPFEADETAGQVVLGLDWEGMGGELWPEGEWTVAVLVDEKQKETLRFRVEAEQTSG